jgi:hypothetical protein
VTSTLPILPSGKHTRGRAVGKLTKAGELSKMNLKNRLTEKEQDLLIRCANSMPVLLTSEELLRFAQAQESEQRLDQAEVALLANVRARKLTDFQEEEDPEVQAILDHFSPEIRDAVQLMSPEEMDEYVQLNCQRRDAMQVQADLMKIAAGRQKERER